MIILILLTYYAGEAAAQGFLHDMAGITMFLLALGLIFLLDVVVTRYFANRAGSEPRIGAAHG